MTQPGCMKKLEAEASLPDNRQWHAGADGSWVALFPGATGKAACGAEDNAGQSSIAFPLRPFPLHPKIQVAAHAKCLQWGTVA